MNRWEDALPVQGGPVGQDAKSEAEGMQVTAVPAGAGVRVLRGFYEGLELPLDRDWLVIGRGRGADLVIHEPTISRAHVAVGFRENGFFVQDLGSTNGTFLNGSRRERASLSDGDEIQMGRLLLRVRVPN